MIEMKNKKKKKYKFNLKKNWKKQNTYFLAGTLRHACILQHRWMLEDREVILK